MSIAFSDEDGKFQISGCGRDLIGPPDPFLKILHFCGNEAGKYTNTGYITRFFPPEVVDLGDINLQWF